MAKAGPIKVNEAPKFDKGELIKGAAALFGTTPELMTGALFDVEQATVEEAKALLKKFTTKEV